MIVRGDPNNLANLAPTDTNYFGSGVTSARNIGNPAAYGSIPAPVAPGAGTNAALGTNLSNLSNLYSLATGVGGASGAGGAANLNAALPGSTAALGNELNLGNTLMAGQLPSDVLTNLEQTAAERGISTGAPGSANSNASLLRDLGLTTLDLEQLGTKDVQSAIGQAPTGPQFNPASMLTTPESALEQLNYDSQLNAAPNPQAAAMANLSALSQGRSSGGAGGLPPTPGGVAAGLPENIGASSSSPYEYYGGNLMLNAPGSEPSGPGLGDTSQGGGNWTDNGDGTYTTPDGRIVDEDGNLVTQNETADVDQG